jgi:hypothetical protein
MDSEDDRVWRVDGQLHRTDGPAVEQADGSREWYVNGLLHRTDGPAAEWADGTRKWYLNGLLHRTDGPAVECADGLRMWWINDQLVDVYLPNFSWSDTVISSRRAAVKQLKRTQHPYAKDLYMADIDRMWPANPLAFDVVTKKEAAILAATAIVSVITAVMLINSF